VILVSGRGMRFGAVGRPITEKDRKKWLYADGSREEGDAEKRIRWARGKREEYK
jgi:hypothetical protein